MKLKLTLTGGELSSLICIAEIFYNNVHSKNFVTRSFYVSLGLFADKYRQKYISAPLKRKNRITLSDMETSAFYLVFQLRLSFLAPYEEMLGRKILIAIDQQHNSEEMYRMAIRTQKNTL